MRLSEPDIRRLADRHRGVGFDQLLLIEPPVSQDTDFFYRIYNRDGGEVEQCGNGLRCLARFVHRRGLTDKKVLAVETLSGVSYPEVDESGLVRVNMGEPVFELERIPFIAEKIQDRHLLSVDGRQVSVSVLSMGNPHAVVHCGDMAVSLDEVEVAVLGEAICHHPRFPKQVNVGFYQVAGRDHLHLRVYERGAGETLACGTGACAAMVVARQRKQGDDQVDRKRT